MKRALTALLLIPPVWYVVFYSHPLLFLGVVAIIASLTFREYARIARTQGFDIGGPLAYGAGLAILLLPSQDLVLYPLAGILLMSFALRGDPLSTVLPRTAVALLGIAYIYGAWRCAGGLRQISAHWLFFALVVNWLGDMAAYFGGRMFGRHKLAPVISPAKTWEGGASSLIVTMGFGLLYLGYYLPATSRLEAILISVTANLAGQLGDLCESGLKRGAGVKDSGTGLPGHGGWLDRVDSSLFTLPVVYFWLAWPWKP